MSGSGGGSSRRRSGAGGSGGSGGVDCSQLIFETVVSSPDPAVLSSTNVGEACDIVLLQNPPRIGVMTRPNGQILGGIGNRWEDLMGCLGQGVQFVAEIRSVDSPVRVLVRPAF